MESDGHLVAPYGALRAIARILYAKFSRRGIRISTLPSRIARRYWSKRNSLKTARTRAWANYDIMRHTFDIITADAESLRKAVREADRAMSERAGNRNAEPVYLAGKVSDKSRPIVYHALKNAPFKSEVTGANVTRYTGRA